MKGFLNFSENTFGDDSQMVGFNQEMYGIWCPPDCDCGCVSTLNWECPINADYGIWPPIDCIGLSRN